MACFFLPDEITLGWSLGVRGSERRLVKDKDGAVHGERHFVDGLL